MDEKEYSNGFLKKPKKPPTHKKRHGAGKIIYDQNGLYIATNELILEEFSVNEQVHVLSRGSLTHLYELTIYYQKLCLYYGENGIKIIKKLTETIKELEKENEIMKKELRSQKTLFNFNEEVKKMIY